MVAVLKIPKRDCYSEFQFKTDFEKFPIPKRHFHNLLIYAKSKEKISEKV